jgi:VWFA-related protein
LENTPNGLSFGRGNAEYRWIFDGVAWRLPVARAVAEAYRFFYWKIDSRLAKSTGKLEKPSMRNKLFLLVLLAAAIPAIAAKRITVDELKQTISLAQAVHRPDDMAVQQLAEVKLTARLTGAQLAQMVAACPGPKTVQALHAIADQSAFLDPPADALSARSAPDQAVQKAIVARSIDYVEHAIATLPNFLATRVTEHYVDTLRGLEGQVSETRGGLFLLNTYRAPIAFRDGRESDDPALLASAASADKKSRDRDATVPRAESAVLGMSSWGDFGPILAVVFLDAANGKLNWARWETEDGKPVAVFHFAVDRAASHYHVNYCCEAFSGTVDYKNPYANSRTLSVVALKPGYHGRLEVDPDTGAVLRISVEADLRKEDPIQRASLMVEYAPVQIGAGKFFCPTRSVSITYSRTEYKSQGTLESTNRLQLNDVEFTGYHRFGSEATLILDADANSGRGGSSETSQAKPTGPTAPAPPAAAPASSEASAPAPAANVTANASAAAIEAASASPPAAPTPTASALVDSEREMQTRGLDRLPGMAGDTTTSGSGVDSGEDDANLNLKVETRSVEVGLIASDKRGKPVTDLKRSELELYDNGRKQELIAFYHEAAATTGSPASAAEQSEQANGIFSNTASSAAQLRNAPDLLILLLDESHLAYADLNRSRAEIEHFLAGSRPATRFALYALNERGFRVIQDVTADQALVAKKLAAWTPDASAVAQAQALEQRNRQQFDTVRNARDLNSVNGNNIDSPETVQTTDPQLRQMGDNPLRYALEGLTALARHFAATPGHKSIVWISGDSALADWQDQAVGTDKGGQYFEVFFLHTREALNEAQISLYAVDASAVAGGAIEASLANRNIEVNPVYVSQPTPLPRDMTDGRVKADMLQNTRGIQTPLRQLAESTGGRAIDKGGDLQAALDAIDRDASSYYELGFDPDTPADGKYHALTLKAPNRKNVVLRYRNGYLYSEEAPSVQQRFQQAVWSPQDAAGIELTAQAVSAADSDAGKSAVRLRIGFPALAFRQQNGRWTDNLYIFVAERDDATQNAQVSGETLHLSLKQGTYDTAMPAGIPYHRNVEPRSKLGSVRIVVVDGNSGKIGTITLPASAFHP